MTRVAVRCADCSFAATYRRLPNARTALDEHESATGHEVTWRIDDLASGVTRAGADAGVCGRPECANEDSPLVQVEPPTDESSGARSISSRSVRSTPRDER